MILRRVYPTLFSFLSLIKFYWYYAVETYKKFHTYVRVSGVRNVTFSGNFAYALNEWSLNMVHGLTSPDLIREIYWNKIANDLSKIVKIFHSKHLKILKSNIKTFLFLFATFSFFCFYFKFVLFVTFKINWTTWLKCINFCIWFSKAINPLNKHCTTNEVFD